MVQGKWLETPRVVQKFFAGRKVSQVRVQFPTGKIVPDYTVMTLVDWVMMFAVTAEGKIVLIQEYRAGVNKVTWTTPAATCETGESPLETARRELLEETGYGAEEWLQLGAQRHAHESNCDSGPTLFLARNCRKTGDQKTGDSEKIDVHLLDAAEVVEMVRDGRIQDMASCLAILLGLKELDRLEDTGF